MACDHHFDEVSHSLFRTGIEWTAAEMDLSSEFVRDDDDGGVFGVFCWSEATQEVYCHDFLWVAAGDGMYIRGFCGFVCCSLTRVAGSDKLLHVFLHPFPSEMLSQAAVRLLDSQMSHERCLVVLTDQLTL